MKKRMVLFVIVALCVSLLSPTAMAMNEREQSVLEMLFNGLRQGEIPSREQLEGPIKQELRTLADTLHQHLLEQREEHMQLLEDLKRESINKFNEAREVFVEEFKKLSETYEELGQLREAYEAHREAVKLNLRDLSAYQRLAQLHENANQYEGIKAFVNGTHPVFDVKPVVTSGRVLVPFRAIAEALEASVEWNEVERVVYVRKDGIEVKLIIDESTAFINDVEYTLDVPAQIMSARTMIPIRFLTEAFGAQVEWDASTQSVIIIKE